MKALALWGALLWLGLCVGFSSRADEVHQPVFYEGRIGPYEARVVIRPPGVIPGLSEIAVRILRGEVTRVSALPIKWNMGKKGAPPADVAEPVRGEENLYATQLWLMEGGAHGIEVILDGGAGQGRVLVPVNSLATRVTGLPPALGGILAVMGLLLVALLASIAGAAVRESVLPPGEAPTRRRRWGARAVTAGVGLLVFGLLWGGWRWWESEASEYRNNRLYRPRSAELAVVPEASRNLLRIGLGDASSRGTPPLVPDHGRLMHLFLVREPDMGAMAHLHPVRLNRKSFEAVLPPLPEGTYSAYAQITHETGFAETVTNRVTIPASNAAAGSAAPTDLEDAWWAGGPLSAGAVEVGDGLRMEWEEPGPLAARSPVSLRFRVRDAAGNPARLEPYLGMMGHVVVRSRDGRLFTHAHPSGSFSMAAQQLFELRESGKAPRTVQFGANDPTCELPSVEASTAGWLAQAPSAGDGGVSFPYEFTVPGSYRLWVQVKSGGKIRTGVFDVEVAAARGRGW